MEARDEMVKVQSMEQLKQLVKLFSLLDLHGRIQVNHFPEMSKKMGDKGLWDWAFKDKSSIKEERELAKARMGQFAELFAKKS